MGETEEKMPEEEPLNPNPIKREHTFAERFKNFKNNITVEPVAFLFITSSMLSGITSQTLNLEKACRVNLDLGDEICSSLRNQNSYNNTQYEKMVQMYLAPKLSWKSVLQSVLPTIALVFVGAWSDKTGRRRIVMLMPLIGEILQCTSNIINIVFFYQLPVEVLIFFDVFFPAMFGGWCTVFIGVFSYISDITTRESRTHRLGFVQFCTYVSIPIGVVLSGVILKNFGYYAAYGTALCIHLINILYLSFKLKDPERTKEQKMHDGRGIAHFFKTFFDFGNVKETFKVVFKRGPNNRRLRICVLLAIVTILFGPMYGEISIMYLTTRYRFNWDEVRFSMFQAYNFVTHTLGTIFSITVFSKYLQWHDSILGIISTLSKIAGSFVYCFAPNEKIFFIAPLVEILNGTSLLAMRSIISKLVASNELGKVNSIFGLTENLMPLVYVPLYTNVYTATMEVLPGAVFLMGAAMTLPAVAVFFWLLYEHRKGVRREMAEKNDTTIPGLKQ